MWTPTPLQAYPAGLLAVTLLALVAAAWRCRPWREAVVLGAVGWGAAVWGITEAQSLLGLVTPTGAILTWSLAAAGAVVLAALTWRRPGRRLRWNVPMRDMAWVTLALTAGLCGVLAVVAYLAPPNTYDSRAYHVPRLFYWVQYNSVAFFPTANDRHLFMSPWPSYAWLQLYLLWGGDQLINSLQWACMLLSLVAGSSVAAALGAGRRAQVAAAGIIAALPIGVVSAAATQSDYTAALWLLIFAYYAFRRLDAEHEPWLDVVAAGAALGLAALSKGTAFVVAPPLVLAYVALRLRMDRRVLRRVGLRLAATALLAAALLTPHTFRNLAAFGHPTTPPFHQQFIMNDSHEPRYVVSNIVRSVLSHVAVFGKDNPEPVMALNREVHDRLGVRDGDPANSHRSQQLRVFDASRANEEITPNPLHLMLYVVAGVGMLVGRRTCRSPRLLAYAGALVLGFVLMCVQVKYQHWLTRLQLPLWVLAAPWAAAVLERWLWARVVSGAAVVLLLLAVPYAIDADRRSLVSDRGLLVRERDHLRVNSSGRSYLAYRSLARRINGRGGIQTLGFITNGDLTEMDLWVALRQEVDRLPRIENVVPDGHDTPPMAIANPLPAPPEMLLTARVRLPSRISVQGYTYRSVYRGPESVSIYELAR